MGRIEEIKPSSETLHVWVLENSLFNTLKLVQVKYENCVYMGFLHLLWYEHDPHAVACVVQTWPTSMTGPGIYGNGYIPTQKGSHLITHACLLHVCVHAWFLLEACMGYYPPLKFLHIILPIHTQLQQTDLCTVFRNYFK